MNVPALLGYGARWLMGGAILAVSHRAAFILRRATSGQSSDRSLG
jgi:hypothetical protein